MYLTHCIYLYLIGRDGEIWTHDPHVPNVVLYQAELHPDYGAYSNRAEHALKDSVGVNLPVA